LRAGRPVLLTDDDDRENEADLIVAASELTEPVMALLIRECSGIVCLCLPPETVERLRLPPMVSRNESRYGTAFTVSIEARHGVTTGTGLRRPQVGSETTFISIVRPCLAEPNPGAN
jgi:3,4-dihydroxy 2-butanone 4-phosphate synthase